MWTKDDYQEHMLGYLVGVREEIECLSHSNLNHHEIIKMLTQLDKAFQHLWWIIGSSDTDWERFRYVLEACCQELLHIIDRVTYGRVLQSDDVAIHSISIQVIKLPANSLAD